VYTWFNRLVAIRFMELHGYLDHGYRVLSTTNYTKRREKDDAGFFRVLLCFPWLRYSNTPSMLSCRG
jgi:hypothetical protein